MRQISGAGGEGGGEVGRGECWEVGSEKRELLQREWGQIEDEEPECVCACVFSVLDEGREIN